MSKNKTQTISVCTLVKLYYEYKISCYLMTYPRPISSFYVRRLFPSKSSEMLNW